MTQEQYQEAQAIIAETNAALDLTEEEQELLTEALESGDANYFKVMARRIVEQKMGRYN